MNAYKKLKKNINKIINKKNYLKKIRQIVGMVAIIPCPPPIMPPLIIIRTKVHLSFADENRRGNGQENRPWKEPKTKRGRGRRGTWPFTEPPQKISLPCLWTPMHAPKRLDLETSDNRIPSMTLIQKYTSELLPTTWPLTPVSLGSVGILPTVVSQFVKPGKITSRKYYCWGRNMRAYSELARCTVSKSVVQVPHSICRNTDRGIAGSFEVKGGGGWSWGLYRVFGIATIFIYEGMGRVQVKVCHTISVRLNAYEKG